MEKRNIWPRILPLLVTTVLVGVVFRGLDLRLLRATFSHIKEGWFCSAVVLYGFLFIPAAWRWHLVLKLAGKAKSFGTTLRFSLIGHFFYTILFGVVGGDSAKAVVYARRHDLPAEEILATAPLDRVLGLAGSLVFAAIAFGVAATAGAFAHFRAASIHLPGRGWGLAAGMAIVLLFALRSRKRAAWSGFAAAFSRHAIALLKSPKTLLAGSLCGLMVQTALSGVLALNLCAVATGSLDWEKLAWTFPLIVAFSALPISVGGLGTREGLATILWGMYGVPKADAVAASLLTLAAGLLWAAGAGLLLAKNRKKEGGHHWRASSRNDAPVTLTRPKQLSPESI